MRSWVKKFFSNGWKLDILFIVMVALFALMTIITAERTFQLWNNEYEPLEIRDIQITTNKAEQGGSFSYTVELCNSTDHLISVDVYQAVFIQNNVTPINTVASPTGGFSIYPGCTPFKPILLVPERMNPGFWTYEAKIRVVEGDKKQPLDVEIGPFEVVNKEE